MNAATETDLVSAQAHTLGIPFETLQKVEIDTEVYTLLPRITSARTWSAAAVEDSVLVVGMTDPSNVFLYDEVKRKARREVKVVACAGADILRASELMSAGSSRARRSTNPQRRERRGRPASQGGTGRQPDLARRASESPIIRFVNYLIADAIKQGASDIHIEPKEKASRSATESMASCSRR